LPARRAVRRLPAQVQVHLTQKESASLKEIALRADQLWLLHKQPAALDSVAAAAAAEEARLEETPCTAMPAKVKAGGQNQQRKKPKKLITFCFLHHNFGKAARCRDDPVNCQFEEN
jgi:hypothetical protein